MYPKSDGAYGYHGYIAHFEDNGSILYVRGDATAAYWYECTATKETKVQREIVWANRNKYSGQAIFVVRDRVNRVNASPQYTAKALFHVMNRPEPINGSICSSVRLYGRPWGENRGGVYLFPGTRGFRITNSPSELLMYILAPAPYASWVRAVGGPNKTGGVWKQDFASNCANYGQTSYEYWIAGRNYASDRSPANRLTDIGDEAADWTLEVYAPPTGTTVDMYYVFVAGPVGQTAPKASIMSIAGGTKRVVLQKGGALIYVNFDTSGNYVSTFKNDVPWQ
jgi:hypothetical protein